MQNNLYIFLAIGVMFAEVNHRCTGIDCAICHTILTLRALLIQLTALLLMLRGVRRLFRSARRPRAGLVRDFARPDLCRIRGDRA